MEKQEMEMEIEIEEGNGKVNLKKLLHGTVYNYWTGLTQTTSFSVVQKLYVLIKHITCS